MKQSKALSSSEPNNIGIKETGVPFSLPQRLQRSGRIAPVPTSPMNSSDDSFRDRLNDLAQDIERINVEYNQLTEYIRDIHIIRIDLSGNEWKFIRYFRDLKGAE